MTNQKTRYSFRSKGRDRWFQDPWYKYVPKYFRFAKQFGNHRTYVKYHEIFIFSRHQLKEQQYYKLKISNYIMDLVARTAFMQYKKFRNKCITKNILSIKFNFFDNRKNAAITRF